jgi:hypothetical protein
MRFEFRIGLTVGLAATLAIALYCLWLWDAERQVARHTENLFHKIEQKKWSAVADFITDDYVDQWQQDRALVLERMRLVLGYAHHFQISATDVDCEIDNDGLGVWRGRITIDGDDAELMAVVKQHLNSLTEPFELRWRHVSGKPWDWKLVRVSNSGLEIPAGFE